MGKNSNNWDIDKYYGSNFTVEELVNTLETIDKFKKKYKDDENILIFEEIVREELCNMFGGKLKDE